MHRASESKLKYQQVPELIGRSGQVFLSKTKSYLQLTSDCKVKLVFFSGDSLGIQPCLRVGSMSTVDGQHEMNSKIFS